MDKDNNDTHIPSIEEVQHWSSVMSRAQTMLVEYAAEAGEKLSPELKAFTDPESLRSQMPAWLASLPTAIIETQSRILQEGFELWQGFFKQVLPGMDGEAQESQTPAIPLRSDRRFSAEAWKNSPFHALIEQSYLMVSEHLLELTEKVEGLSPAQKKQIDFAVQNMVDAASPANFIMTNPQVIDKIIETKGDNLLKGLEHLLTDLRKGQITHTDPNAFELGRNIAVTPGKVIHEKPMFQLIQYSPATEKVLEIPLVIFPPWINRFYILDLNEKKSFIKWAVDQGITVFMVSWKSADESMVDVIWDDYIKAQIEAIDIARDVLNVPHVHTIGYCVAGTTLAATLAFLAKRGEADKVKSATFFTAQVDFERAGDLKVFIEDDQLKLINHFSKKGYLDGRYLALTFNMLRGRDLIWNYVVNNYLMGDDYPPFDLLHWNGDTTNLPAKWHGSYLRDLYRDNKLVQPGALTVDGTPIDLRLIKTPSYVQAGREDHIAPLDSVWKITDHLSGPVTFVLAGSGHIAGVVNPPSAQKYQYWTNDAEVGSLDEFIADAQETKGSWWPHWIEWLISQDDKKIAATKARIPGKGKKKAIEDAPGRYVKTR